MLKIAIVDDEQKVLDYLKKQIESFFEENAAKSDEAIKEEYKIETYLSGKNLLEAMDKTGKSEPDILFLDMEMPDMDGIEVGRQLRKNNVQCKIIMATGNIARFKESFQINAFRYVTKPFDREEIYEALRECLAQRIGTKVIVAYHDRNPYELMEKDITYIQAYNGYTYLYAGERQYRSEESLNYYEENLDNRIFFKVHRQFLINLLWVECYEKGNAWVAGQEIKIARTRQKAFEAAVVKSDVLRG